MHGWKLITRRMKTSLKSAKSLFSKSYFFYKKIREKFEPENISSNKSRVKWGELNSKFDHITTPTHIHTVMQSDWNTFLQRCCIGQL
jgi:hypothetical protein